MSSVFVVVSVMYAFFLWIWRLILKTRDRSERFFQYPTCFKKVSVLPDALSIQESIFFHFKSVLAALAVLVHCIGKCYLILLSLCGISEVEMV